MTTLSPSLDLAAVARSFSILGNLRGLVPYGSGHINDTFAATFDQAGTPVRYLLQRINHNVFKNPGALMENVSRAYVYRVAEKFRNNGAGTRGDLAAVVRAILVDHEARSPEVAANVSFGKLKEPVLRLSHLLRAFDAKSASGRFLGYQNTVDGVPITSSVPRPATQEQINRTPNTFSTTRLDGVQGSLAQAALRSPTVFNFYHSDYVLPGALAAAGLVVPEFEITDDNYAISVPNFLRTWVNATVPTGTPPAPLHHHAEHRRRAGHAREPRRPRRPPQPDPHRQLAARRRAHPHPRRPLRPPREHERLRPHQHRDPPRPHHPRRRDPEISPELRVESPEPGPIRPQLPPTHHLLL